ncbi:hypothetical protein Taro_012377 [Colocasia esculenta]|uniref:H(+)/Pi cotransporter n=1 Tax=Colocasia esculenta TaxID=4460 RepID=A0A843UDD2_COLES|nr:hypothetical protein [Colocasia esculenta]
MKRGLRCQRILILSLLSLSVLAPVTFLSARLGNRLFFDVWFVYYDVQLNVENLNFNLYLSMAVNVLMEIPTVILGSVLLSFMGRRTLFSSSTALAGTARLLCIPFAGWRKGSKGSWAQLAAEVVGFMAVSTAFDVLYVYCMELFPTNVRNFAVSMLRQALMLGVTLVVLGQVSPKLFFVVFGCLSLFSGALTVWLPETRDAPLYETMEQQEIEEKRKLREGDGSYNKQLEGGEGLKEPVREILKDKDFIEPLIDQKTSADNVSTGGKWDGGENVISSDFNGSRIETNHEQVVGVTLDQNVPTSYRTMDIYATKNKTMIAHAMSSIDIPVPSSKQVESTPNMERCVQSSASVIEPKGKETLMLDKKVKLCNMEGHLVANAIILSLDKSKMVMGKSLGEEYYEIAILFADKSNAPLFAKDNE